MREFAAARGYARHRYNAFSVTQLCRGETGMGASIGMGVDVCTISLFNVFYCCFLCFLFLYFMLLMVFLSCLVISACVHNTSCLNIE